MIQLHADFSVNHLPLMIRMKKEDLERKLRIERFERCLNCKNFWKCGETKDLIEICEHFEEEPIERQKVVVNLVEFSKLGGSTIRNCSF